jgi:hypothetical protein
MKHKIEFIYREVRGGIGDRHLRRKLRTCPLPLLNSLVRLSWDDDQSGSVQVEIGAMRAEAMTFAFHKDVQLSLDGKPASLANVSDMMGNFPEWASISRRLAEGVFVVGDSIYTDVEEAVDEYLSKCERAGKWDVRLPDGTLLPLA